jgi:hypothetical protein
MTTYVALQNRISMEIRTISAASSSGIQDQIKAAILSAVAFYAREPFFFNTTTGTFNTVVDREYYSSSDFSDLTNVVTINSMSVTQNGVKRPVKPLDFVKIDDAQTGEVKAIPEYYAYYKQNIRLYPIPDAVYTMTLAYVYKLTALSLDADSNAWTTDAEELIRCHAKADIYENLLKEYDAADRMKLRAAQVMASLKRETRLRRSNNMLRVDDALVTPSGYDIYSDR